MIHHLEKVYFGTHGIIEDQKNNLLTVPSVIW